MEARPETTHEPSEREVLEFLDIRGCDCFQGFWMSKPLPASDFAEFVTQRR